MKKFRLTTESKMFLGKKLYRIEALISFGNIKAGELNIKAGELGGYIEKEENLDQTGNAWVYGDAQVYGNARVYDNARVGDNARVYGDARVYGNARVGGDAWVYGNAWVYDNARVGDNARVYGDARVGDNARVYGDADYTTIKGFGSEFRCTTFFRQRNNDIGVVCGCFKGTLEEFRKKVRQTHGETKFAKEYLMIADLMENHFK